MCESIKMEEAPSADVSQVSEKSENLKSSQIEQQEEVVGVGGGTSIGC